MFDAEICANNTGNNMVIDAYLYSGAEENPLQPFPLTFKINRNHVSKGKDNLQP